jgi:hypothetical protein
VTKIAYGRGSVTYSTFDQESTDALRLDFVPDSVIVGGKPASRRKDLAEEGYTFDDTTHVLSIRHMSSRDVDIQGAGDRVPPAYVTFDDPHLAAGTPLIGHYPSGVIDWGKGDWQIGTPHGKFATFTLALADPKIRRSNFNFNIPLIFSGIDAYNDGDTDAIVTISSPEIREISFTIKPKELRRLRTGWRDPSSRVSFDFTNGDALRFDNLAYLHP